MEIRTPSDRIIVALDVPTESAALALAGRLRGHAGFFKIGLQLFTMAGPSIVRRIRETGTPVFLDLKFHDIPNTVQHAVASACELGVEMMTLHLSGGAQMIRAACAGADGSSALLLGVTVLTSSNRETLQEIAIESSVENQVERLARLALANGLRGLVASPLEVAMLREKFGRHFTIVTPGVRPAGADLNDQQRTLTPAAAVKAGADYLVIGRPITAASSPADAARKIADELA